MRFLPVLFSLFVTAGFSAVPPELAAALTTFRADAPKGWSFTQTTSAQGESTVERCDAAKPEFDRWSLVEKNGRPPTADETREYGEMRSRRSRGGTAPNLSDQFDIGTLETWGDSGGFATYRCRLKPSEKGDATARYLRATLIVHRATNTLASVELASISSFSPTFAVNIDEMQTVMTYRPPAAGVPMLPQTVKTRVRGRAFWFKSLDAEMIVTFSDYVRARSR